MRIMIVVIFLLEVSKLCKCCCKALAGSRNLWLVWKSLTIDQYIGLVIKLHSVYFDKIKMFIIVYYAYMD